jgi:hypothetical protein
LRTDKGAKFSPPSPEEEEEEDSRGRGRGVTFIRKNVSHFLPPVPPCPIESKP